MTNIEILFSLASDLLSAETINLGLIFSGDASFLFYATLDEFNFVFVCACDSVSGSIWLDARTHTHKLRPPDGAGRSGMLRIYSYYYYLWWSSAGQYDSVMFPNEITINLCRVK